MADGPKPPLPHDHLPPAPPLTVTSDDVADGKTFPRRDALADAMGMTRRQPFALTCDGTVRRRRPGRSR